MTEPTELEPKPLYSELLATPEEVNAKIDELAKVLIEDYQGLSPLFVCLWKGGVLFASRLMSAIALNDPHFHPELDGMTVSRYGGELVGRAPEVVMGLSPKTKIIDRPVVILDDMIDGGDTYTYTKQVLETDGAADVRLAVLVQRERPPRKINADYFCFSVSTQEWLTGMGLDDPRIAPEANRWAGYIAIANAPVPAD